MNDVTVVFTSYGRLDFLCGYFNNWKDGVKERYYNLNKVDNIFKNNE
jgi:hypothetical protein